MLHRLLEWLSECLRLLAEQMSLFFPLFSSSDLSSLSVAVGKAPGEAALADFVTTVIAATADLMASVD